MSCVECGSEAPKYKCPACLAKYCCVACCKSHKTKNCTPIKKDEKAAESLKDRPAASKADNLGEVEIENSEDFMPADRLAQLAESEEVKALLYNPHLRSMLTDLVNSPCPGRDMDVAMHEPLFLELADACLKVVDADKDQDVASRG